MSESVGKDFRISAITGPLDIGTRIYWDSKNESLYFVDLPQSYVYKYNTKTKKLSKVKVGDEPLPFAFPVANKENTFIAGLGRKFVTFKWSGEDNKVEDLTVIAEVDNEGDLVKNRLNGAKIDPYGVLWAGTMGPEGPDGAVVPGKGSLYSLQKGVLKKHETNIGISNGLAWDLKKKKMYYVDTLSPEIVEYDYDKDAVKISNKRTIFNIKDAKLEGLPDGLAIDHNGNLWITLIFGSAIIQVDPNTGNLLQRIKMFTTQPTSITFGGKSLDVMYVTTARIPVNGKVPNNPEGSTYEIANIGVTGPLDTGYIM